MSTAHLYVPKAQYEAKVSELQAQVAQLKDDRDTWMGQAKRANLQVAQLQTTVGHQAKQLEDSKTGRGLAKMDISTLRTALQKYGSHRPECDSWSRPNKASGKHCSCGFAALATCPAPAKENE